MPERSAQSTRADADAAATEAANDAAENADLSASDARDAARNALERSKEALENSRQAAEAASQRTSTTYGAVESRPTSDTFTTLDGSTVTASTDETVYVLDEGRVVRYDPTDGDADGNGWVPLGRWNAVLDAPEGTVLRGDVEERHSESPSEWNTWDPPSQPAYDGSGSEPDLLYDTASGVISNLWETLRANHSDVTRSSIGTDVNGNDMWLYDFEPPSWQKKVVCLGLVHGIEPGGMLAIYRTLKEAYNNYYSHPSLAWARWKVRWLVIPVCNPSGYNLEERTNANGVDLNRQTSYKWLSYDARKITDSQIDTGTDRITLSGHGLTADEKVQFHVEAGESLPSPLNESQDYFVQNPTTDDFQLSETSGGSVIDITSTGTGARFAYFKRPDRSGEPNESFSYKGREPFSQDEAVNIKSVIDSHPDAVAVLDHHTLGDNSGSTPKYRVNQPDTRQDGGRIFISEVAGALADQTDFDNNDVILGAGERPNWFNYGAEQGHHSYTAEWKHGSQGGGIMSSTDVTRLVRWQGNLMLRAAHLNEQQSHRRTTPKVWQFSEVTGSNTIPQGSYQTISGFETKITPRIGGVLVYQASVTLRNETGGDGRVLLTPKLGQDSTPFLASESTSDVKQRWEIIQDVDDTDRETVSLSAAIPVQPADDGRPVRVGLFAQADITGIDLLRYNATLMLFPSDRGARLTQYLWSQTDSNFFQNYPSDYFKV